MDRIGDYETRVTLLAATLPVALGGDEGEGLSKVDSATDLIEWSGRLCYNSEGATGTRKGWVQSRMEAGHVSILEHASASFYIVCSRVVTHELVRHRLASYSQRSQRYVKETEPQYITPPEIVEAPSKHPGSTDTPLTIFIRVMDVCWSAYGMLIEAGISPEIARYVLPNACQTEIVTTMNFRELGHFIKLRTSPKALPEMREVAFKIKRICEGLAPQVFVAHEVLDRE